MLKSKRTVLVVDDFPPDREAYRRYLLDDVDFFYQIIEAQSASDALNLCQKEHIDGILLDFLLPDLNGLEFLAKLKTQTNGYFPPVVIITGQGSEEIAVKAIKSGAEDYLVKGAIKPEDLRQAVSCAIEKGHLRRNLQASEERFRISVENMLDCFGICSAIRDESGQIVDFRINYLNPAAMDSNRMTTEDIGKKLCEMFPVHYESGLFGEYCQVVETGQPLLKESLIYTDVFGKEILTRAYDIRASKLEDGIVLSWRDITEKKQTEIALRESERKFRAIFNSTFQFIGLLNTDGILLEANQTALDFARIKQEDVINRPFWEAKWWTISSETQLQLKQAIECASKGSFVRYEVEVLGANDFVITIDFSLKPVRDENGQVVLIIPEGHDITERKRLELQLRDSETLLNLAMNSAQMGFWDLNLLTLNGIWSSKSKELLGLPPDWNEDNFTTLISCVHPDDREFMRQLQTLAIDAQGKYEAEFRVVWPDGSIHWLADRGQTFYDQTGQAVRVVGMVEEITEKKQAQEQIEKLYNELQSRVDELQTIFDIMPAGIAISHDPTCEVVRTNAFAENLMNVAPNTNMSATAPQAERVPYKQLRDGKEIPSEELPMYISAKQGIEIRNSEIQIVRADGISLDLLVNTKPLFDAQQKVRGCIAAFMDITEQKLALSALQESEALFRGIFDSDLIGILLWNYQGQITNANDAFIKMTGYTREDLQAGKIYFKNITPKEYHKADAQKIEILYKNGGYKPFEKEYICKDGSRIPVLLGCAFLPGYQDRGVAFCLDISERKRSEQERERLLAEAQAARTEAIVANQTKDEFLAIVSHELRAPLNSILGWAKLLQTRPFDQAIAKRALETIERNAKSQSQIIEDLLDISRMIKGNLRLEKAPVNLIEVIEASIDIVSPTALTKQINLEFAKNNEINTPLIVCGDFNRLQQVVLNLLTNAVKFTPNEGQVRIELSRSETPTHPHLHSAIIKVRDTGKGIKSEFLPYVFERFRQASNSSRAKDGLGLGLAIVRNLVELHHGTVTAASPGKDQGATFTVILPLLGHGE